MRKHAIEQAKQADELEVFGPHIQLADQLHEFLCHSNHTDGCSYHYESWENPGYTKTHKCFTMT